MTENSPKIRVVVVDDNADTINNLKKLLYFEKDVEIVGTASSGEEGIARAVEKLPDVVLMDINMPGMDGISASEAITARMPGVQIVIMSVQAEADYLRRAMLAGAREFLIKPFSSEQLANTLRAVYQLGANARPPAEKPATTGAAAYIDLTGLDPIAEEALATWLGDAGRTKAMHDAKGPMQALAARGLPLSGLSSDTALAAYLVRRRSGDLVSALLGDVELIELFYAHTISPLFVAILVPGGVLIVNVPHPPRPQRREDFVRPEAGAGGDGHEDVEGFYSPRYMRRTHATSAALNASPTAAAASTCLALRWPSSTVAVGLPLSRAPVNASTTGCGLFGKRRAISSRALRIRARNAASVNCGMPLRKSPAGNLCGASYLPRSRPCLSGEKNATPRS